MSNPVEIDGRRLLFCCEHYFPSRGGVAEVMRQIAERLVQRGHQVTVATSWNPERTSRSHNGVAIEDFKISGNLAQGMLGEVDRYRAFVTTFGADATLIKAAQQWTFDALWPVLDHIAGRKVFIPCGFASLYDPAYAAYFAKVPEVLRKFDHLIFYAQTYRDIELARAYGLSNLSVLPNGASETEFDQAPDPGFRARLGIPEGDFVFLTVGAPLPAKGHPQIAEAFARLQTDGRPATLILNGNWPESVVTFADLSGDRSTEPARSGSASALRRAAALLSRGARTLAQGGARSLQTLVRRGLERRRVMREMQRSICHANSQGGKRVLCTNLSRPDLVQAYMTSDLFVFASIVEYSPLVLFEAAAAGTPFLSVPVGNAQEIASWTGGGVICPAAKDREGYTRADVSTLAEAMEGLMKNSALRARLGKTGKERWRQEFTWRSIAPRYEAILRGAAA